VLDAIHQDLKHISVLDIPFYILLNT
jgi:hypothetical protein